MDLGLFLSLHLFLKPYFNIAIYYKMSFFNREEDKRIKDDLEVLIRKLMRNELSNEETLMLKQKLQQGSLQSLMPEYFTHLLPEQRVVETARMIKAFDKYGYQVGTNEINPAFESELSKPLHYSNGIKKSLTESFGDFLPEHSNSDFVTMKRPNEKPRVFFRGSKMNYNDPNMIKDWMHNISTIPLEGNPLRNNYGNILVDQLKGQFDNIISQYGGIERVAGFSKGGALAGHLILRQMSLIHILIIYLILNLKVGILMFTELLMTQQPQSAHYREETIQILMLKHIRRLLVPRG
jgi:hypothetical protein